ncbi:hypothetical protein KKF81_01100 [Candidatus Micrarchaeota archaeon]|nr:hypothetical protein [Candidatus Micrarchaeota archaeon]MBU1165517.1 hypothetical protein [Candidatus Micrarchaeota archaeon]MBU1887415.1 hypothetical protein [Candidatus Micrarchaeota archaeon]
MLKQLQLPDFKDFKKLPNQLIILFATLALYLITNALLGNPNNPYSFVPLLIGLFVVVEIFFFVGLEVKDGAQKHGWKHEIVDTVIALAVAVALWYVASFLLNTSSPISAVVSCSMLPNLQRGDFVIIQGAPAVAYEIDMTRQELDSLNNNAIITYPDGEISINGSLFSYCLYNKMKGLQSDVCTSFMETPDQVTEKKGAFTYQYQYCPITIDTQQLYQPCVSSIWFRGNQYFTNFSHDTIVYSAPKSDYYSMVGDIVHRALFRINVVSEDKSYYLTRGDNNPILDLQVYDYNLKMTNHPIPEELVKGRVIMRIPILGYFKLLLSGFVQEDPQCRTQLEFEHV